MCPQDRIHTVKRGRFPTFALIVSRLHLPPAARQSLSPRRYPSLSSSRAPLSLSPPCVIGQASRAARLVLSPAGDGPPGSPVTPVSSKRKTPRLGCFSCLAEKEGFEAKPLLRCPKNAAQDGACLHFSTAARKSPPLHLPPAARRSLSPRRYPSLRPRALR